ncbi:DHA2 family efflux MFS transporter permease subunit [Sphingomonas ginsenosidivorax]|uniref:DHA2 family efflux MFS transporter permease subunit n=1 Tax=Sphingomonas ginsenosidivorax TaxID=862135 RepID=A0A5C6U647_9SPHN|nr:DHA2 family efflux MFS transporter permease subunit [Sphingomonas ginsenosidivorax]TXC68030.1 DHA2 family efflux MFS transporter permease subunit [Sphingomonas ginsenosidivorax]
MALKYKVAIVTVFALFVDLLDLTTVNLASPTLRREFGASIGLAQLAVTAYVVTVAIVMPASGWAADRFGAKRTFLFSLAVFTLGSALCGAAWSMHALIAARAMQGIGGGLLVPVGMAILFRAFPEQERATASAIFSVPAAVAPALGPFLGGILIDAASWRWIFLINVPIGILGFGLGVLWLKENRIERGGPFDARGFVLGALGFMALTIALSSAPDGPLMRPGILIPLLGGILILAAFVRIELKTDAPMVDLRLFEGRDFAVGNATMFLASVGFGGLLFALPLLLQGPHGFSAARAGTIMATHAVGIIVTTVAGPKLIERVGRRIVLAIGLLGSGVSTLAFALTDQATSQLLLGLILLVAGGSFGLTVVPLQTAPFRGMDQAQIARGTSMLSVIRQLGVVIGTAAVAVPLGQMAGAAGFATAFILAGLLILIAVPIAALLPSGNRDQAEPRHTH